MSTQSVARFAEVVERIEAGRRFECDERLQALHRKARIRRQIAITVLGIVIGTVAAVVL